MGAPHERFSVDVGGRIFDGERLLGQLARGPTLLLPDVRLAALEDLGAGARSRVLRRLVAFARDLVEALLAPLRSPEVRALPGAARGIVYQLEQGLGTAAARDAEEQVAELAPEGRRRSRRTASRWASACSTCSRCSGAARWSAASRCAPPGSTAAGCPRPAPGAVSMAVAQGVDPRAYAAIGYPVFGTRRSARTWRSGCTGRSRAASRRSGSRAGSRVPRARGAASRRRCWGRSCPRGNFSIFALNWPD